ncbi:Ly86 [Phodopus roborovskii]|uniref:Ly86 protein n=1 Tax=Phodopus roborovskii TaxID=109678 RepID=A0AAU9ZNG4_PHORO|nr:Ly86 [Phodopus roborovskii]
MNSVAAALLVWTLTSPSSSGHGRGDAWPTHMACSSGGLEVLYQSCGEDIRELFLDIALISRGSSILNYSYPICENDLPKFSFCGRRKGGKPPGEYQVLLELYNENHATVACANATVISS